MSYLRAGKISVAEAATIADVSRIAVHKWCRAEGIDPKMARRKEVLRIAARIREEVLQVVKRSPRRGVRGRGKWIDRGKDKLSEG